MISGTLPNNTVWWLSTDGKKIWVESKDLEQDKFKEKGYNASSDSIFHVGHSVGELTTSRLDSRRKKDAWVIRAESVMDVYPELMYEIQKKEIENKKKKRGQSALKNKKSIAQKTYTVNKDSKEDTAKINNVGIEKTVIERIGAEDPSLSKDTLENKGNKEPRIESFHVSHPYVSLIKDEVEKSEDGKVILPYGTLKEKMGGEFLEMHDLRVFYGLKKILLNVGISVEQGRIKNEHAVIMKKMS